MLTDVTQHITDSSLFYFFGDHIKNFPKNFFTILKTQTYETKKFLLEMHIIGQSHFFTLTDKASQTIIIIEALACVSLPNIIPTFAHSFSKSEPFDFSFHLQPFGITITSSAYIIPSFEKNKAVVSPSCNIFIEYIFPGNLSPKTLLSLQENKNSFTIHTLHEFAQKTSVQALFTETKITFE